MGRQKYVMQQNEINTNIWNTGIYLSQAPFQFAPENIRAEWREASKRNGWAEAQTKLDMKKIGNGGFVEVAQEILSTVKSANLPKEQLQTMMCKRVVQCLLCGDLIAFAFETPRKINSVPFKIDAHHWHGRIDWSNNFLTSQGLEFIQIRLATKNQADLEKFSIEYAALSPDETEVVLLFRTGLRLC